MTKPDDLKTISQVSDYLHISQHVIRFWETRFPQIQPIKRDGGRRYYRREDIAILEQISDLLYVKGYTIRGVAKILREEAAPEAPWMMRQNTI